MKTKGGITMMEKPTIALMYDFDKTLCTKDMQEYTFIPNVNMSTEEFWEASDVLSEKKKMDRILAYMYMMLEKSHEAKQSIHREAFVEMGKDIEFFPGVCQWFDRINEIGDSLGVNIQHYVISSGLHEIIEGSEIYDKLHQVFACEFLYDENNVACWPKNAVNYTTKTQFLFRINKGVLDISNDVDLNKYTPEEERPIPFRNMIYIGDGLTDVPCMKLVKSYGGYSIAVYKEGGIDKVKDLLHHQRVDFIELADYREDSSLFKVVRDIITAQASKEKLARRTNEQISNI